MDIEKLRTHIRALITTEETEAPVLSCYLDLEAGYRHALDGRVRVLRKGLGLGARPAFEEALSRIEIFLTSELWPGAKGAALFARGGERHFMLPLQFQVPLPNRTMALEQLGASDPTAHFEDGVFTKVFLDGRGLPQRHRLAWDGERVHVEVTTSPGSDGLAAWAHHFPIDDGLDASARGARHRREAGPCPARARP